MLRFAWSLVILSLLLWAAPVRAQGRLQQVRQATNGQPTSPPAPEPTASSSSSSSTSDNSTGNQFLNGLFDGMEPDEALTMAIVLPLVGAAAVTSPFWGPAYFLDDSLSKPGYFPFHPYAAGLSGYMQIDGARPVPVDGRDATFGDPDYLKSWSVRLAVEDGNDFRGLNRLNGRLAIDTTLRLGLWTNWNYLHESLDGGRTDDTLLSDTDLTYRVAQSDWMVVHIGAGLRMLNDRTGSRFGGNFLYSADVFPVEPLVISALIDGGWLDSAGVIHGRATVGVMHRSWEVYLGYDFMRIGSVNIQGPLAGVRFWF